MQKKLLLFFILLNYLGFSQNPNLIYNGNVELFSSPSSTPTGWSSSSDFGSFNQNTSDVTEGNSSVQFNPQFNDLMMFTTTAVSLEAGKTYIIKYNYKFLGSDFDENDNIRFQIYLNRDEQFSNFISIENNDWNTVEVSYQPSATNMDAEASITVTPAFGGSNYPVLFDDIQIKEAESLSNKDVTVQNTTNLLYLGDNEFQIKKTSNTQISNVTVYSILGTQQQIVATSKTDFRYNLNNLSSGMYVFHISTNKGQVAKKVLVK